MICGEALRVWSLRGGSCRSVLRREREQPLVDEPVIDHHIGPAKGPLPFEGQKSRIARSRSD